MSGRGEQDEQDGSGKGEEHEPPHLFDQTNGLMTFDPGTERDGDAPEELTLFEKDAASNIVNGGMGGF